MDFEATYCTDVGVGKEINQDSGCVMIADTPDGPICMAFLCDGMGGISMGEYASGKVTQTFVNWFEQTLPDFIARAVSLEEIAGVWKNMLIDLDQEFREYGQRKGLKLGTTATGMLFWRGRFLLMQSGDSRAYEIGRNCRQLSEDQSYVWQQVKLGLLMPEEAKHHPKRNVLLDCIGGSRPSVPEWKTERVGKRSNYLLCSDGFVHEINNSELVYFLAPRIGQDVDVLRESLEEMTEIVKRRGEKDNITALLIRTENRKKKYQDKGFYFHVRQKIILTQGRIELPEAAVTTEEE